MTPREFNERVLNPALNLLPAAMDSAQARVMLIAIALQESRLIHRWQVIDPKRSDVKGPARGLFQFEKGTRASRGGVWGVFLHPASKGHLAVLCKARSVACDPDAIYAALEYDDVLAAGVARLLLWTDPKVLPAVGDADAGWALYLRTWRPGKPHPQTWPALYRQALAAVGGEHANVA